MSIEDFKKKLETDRIRFQIQLAEKALVFWSNVETERRSNPNKYPSHILFPFIKAAKECKKRAQSDLDYYRAQLKELRITKLDCK